jgi:hypothetical protein
VIEIASQIVLCLAIAAVIGFFIGLLIGKSFGTSSSAIYSGSKASYGAVQGNIYNKPLIRSSPRPVGKDDLKEIENIDIELEAKLNELGIYHFDQIAKWSPKNCHWVEEFFVLEDNQIRENNWIEEAKNLSRV